MLMRFYNCSYTCKDHYEFQPSGAKTMNITCQSNGTWSELEACKQVSCLGAPPGPADHDTNLASSWDGYSHVRKGESVFYNCPKNMVLLNDPTERRVEVRCGRSDADADVLEWKAPVLFPTQCVHTLWCDAPIDRSTAEMKARRHFHPATVCPTTHPFAANGGQICCESPKKKDDTTLDAACDGSRLQTFDPEVCCMGQHVPCPHPDGACEGRGQVFLNENDGTWTANASSWHNNQAHYHPKHTIDGLAGDDVPAFVSGNQSDNFLLVQLADVYHVEAVLVWLRPSYYERFVNVEALVGDRLCGRAKNATAPTRPFYTFHCEQPILGESIRLRMTGSDRLEAAEIGILAQKLTTTLPTDPFWISDYPLSSHSIPNATYHESNALDGSLATSFLLHPDWCLQASDTAECLGPWWAVDLFDIYPIDGITVDLIDTSKTTFVDISVHVTLEAAGLPLSSQPMCAQTDSTPPTDLRQRLKCRPAPLEGDRITISKQGSYLEFAEIQINVATYTPEVPPVTDCSELYRLGYTLPGTYQVDITDKRDILKTIPVYCRDGWTYILKRGPYGNTDLNYFNRGWDEYVKGFGNPDEEYWLGLDPVFQLTQSATYSLRMDVTNQKDVSKSALYESFLLKDNNDHYQMFVDGYSSEAHNYLPDAVSGHNGIPFSAPDNDTNPEQINPNIKEVSGGWIRAFSLFNFFGQNLQTEEDTSQRGIFHRYFGGSRYSLKKASLAIRPKNFDVNLQLSEEIVDTWMDLSKSRLYLATYSYSCIEGMSMVGGPQVVEETCTWDEIWEARDTFGKCEWSHCRRPPTPPPENNLKMVWDGNPVEIGENLAYKCKEGTRPKPGSSVDSVSAVCGKNNTFSIPDPWLECVPVVTCPKLPLPPDLPEIGGAILHHQGTRYGPCLGRTSTFEPVHSCPSIRVRVEDKFYANNSLIVSQIHFLSNFTTQPADLILDISFTEEILTEFFLSPLVLSAEPGRSKSDVRLFLNASAWHSTGFNNMELRHATTPGTDLCFVDVVCHTSQDTLDFTNSTSSRTFQPDNTSFFDGASIEYSCGEATAFGVLADGSVKVETLNFTCGSDGQWDRDTSLPTCVWTKCYSPPIPGAETNMIATNWNGLPVPIGDKIIYTCKDGGKVEDNFTLGSLESECFDNNIWTPVEWHTCVPTKYCPQPPPKIDAGFASVLNSGLTYSSKCLGSNLSAPGDYSKDPVPADGCGEIWTMLITSLPLEKTYKLQVKFDAHSNKLVALLTFSQPVTNQSVAVQGEHGVTTLEGTSTATVLILRADLNPDIDTLENTFYLTISIETEASPVPCLLQAVCRSCDSQDACQGQLHSLDVFNLHNLTLFGTQLRYGCPLASQFLADDGSLFDHTEMTCQWDGTWSPTDVLKPCQATACINPPQPPTSTKLQWDYTPHTIVAFGENVTYRCLEDHFFVEDYSLPDFVLTCQDDGSWSDPLPWKECIHPAEQYCPTPPEPSYNGGKYDWNPNLGNNTPYDTVVTYSCDIARTLQSPAGTQQETQDMTCLWNKTWSMSESFRCVWTHCLDPPTIANMNHNFDGTPIDFHAHVSYTCQLGTFFEEDRDKQDYKVECLDMGYYDEPMMWPKCVETVFCQDPPARPMGGTRKWTQEREYLSEATYTCGHHADFRDPETGEVVQTMTAACQWSKQWSLSRMDFLPCVYKECSIVPTPPLSSGLKHIPMSDDANIDLTTNFHQYDPKFPISIYPPEEFGTTRHIYIDGKLAETPSATLSVILADRLDLEVFRILLDPNDDKLLITNDIDSTVIEAMIFLDPGEPFFLRVIYDPLTLSFEVSFKDEITLTHLVEPGISLMDFSELKLIGEANIDFFGFVTEGYNHAVPIGKNFTFGCEDDHAIFPGGFKTMTIECGQDGLFNHATPWPRCVSTITTTTEAPTLGPNETEATEAPTTTVATELVTYMPEEVLYPRTTDYHWPNFHLNASIVEGEWSAATGVGYGPFGFGSSVALHSNSCMVDTTYLNNNDDDQCQKNPLHCDKGLSFSIWEKIEYDPALFVNLSQEVAEKRYVVSTGADFDPATGKAYPGFAIYHQGIHLVAVVSTGEQVWELRVSGQLSNNSWSNIGVRWEKPDLSDPHIPFDQRGGLELFVNLKRVGIAVMPEFTEAGMPTFDPMQDYQINGIDPPVMMVGCSYDYEKQQFGHFSNAEYDEMALWSRRLGENSTHDETIYFFGGFNTKYENINPEQVKAMVKGADLGDDYEFAVAQEIMEVLVLEPVTTVPPWPTRTTQDTTTPPGNAATGADGEPTTTTTTTASPEELAKTPEDWAREKLTIQNVMSSMLNVDGVQDVRPPDAAEMRFPMTIVGAKTIAGDEKNSKKWQAVHDMHPDEEGAPKTLRQLNEYMLAWGGAANTSSQTKTNFFNPETGSLKYATSGDDFVMNCDKLPKEAYREKPRLQYPNYDGLEWILNKAKWDSPKDVISVPTGMYKDQEGCTENDVTFVVSIFNELGRVMPRRRNMAQIFTDDWYVGSKVASTHTRANPDPLDDSESAFEDALRCTPDPVYMRQNPVRLDLYHKRPGKARIVRRTPLATWLSDMERDGIEVRHCARWNEDFGTNGAWDPNGCKLVYTDEVKTRCECSHFGSYAVIVELTHPVEIEDDCFVLTVVKYVGIAVSACLLLFLIVMTVVEPKIWDMFHFLRMHIAITWMFALTFHVLSDLDAVRDDRLFNLLVGFVMKYFYTASAMWVVCETHATFKAFTSGIISGRTKVYFPFGYGTPLIPLGVLFIAFNDDLGLDPRCMVGWNKDAKHVYLLYNIGVSFLAIVFSIIIVFNLARPQTKRRNVVADLTSQANGLVATSFLKLLLWILALFTYTHPQDSDRPDPYCVFAVILGWFGLILFLCLGLGSKKFRKGISRNREKQYMPEETANESSIAEPEDTFVESEDEDSPERMASPITAEEGQNEEDFGVDKSESEDGDEDVASVQTQEEVE